MIWQALAVIILTLMIGISSMSLDLFQASKRIYLKSLAAGDYLTSSRAGANFLRDSSSEFINSIKIYIAADDLEASNKLEILSGAWLEFRGKLHGSSASALQQVINYGVYNSDFIRSLNNEINNNSSLYNYDYELYHSDFLEAKLSSTTNSYKSSLIDNTKLSPSSPSLAFADLDFEADFVEDENLLVSEELLEILVEDTELRSSIREKPEDFDLEISDEGLKLEDFPNTIALRVDIPKMKFTLDNDQQRAANDSHNFSDEKIAAQKLSNDSDEHNLEFIVTAQLDLSKTSLKPRLEVPPPASDPPTIPVIPSTTSPITRESPLPSSPSIPALPKTEDEAEIGFGIKSLPNSQQGIFSNPLEGISEKNPLRVASAKSDGLSSFHLDDNGNIVMSIGKLGDSSILNSSEANFNSESFDTIGADSNDDAALVLDLLPRQHKRYGNVDDGFKINGIEIPEGAVVVATKSSTAKNRVEKNSDFQYFKVYDSSGALITKFHKDSLASNKKLKNIDLQSFNTAKGTTDLDGSKIFQSFSSAELFSGLDPTEANQAFLNIQSDLAASQQLNINERNKNWHKDLYQDFKEEGISYSGETLTVLDKEKAAEKYISERSYVDETAKDLDKGQYQALLDLETARADLSEAKDDLSSAKQALKEKGLSKKEKIDLKELVAREEKDLKQAQKAKKSEDKAFKQARKSYDNYIAKRAPPKPSVTVAKPKAATRIISKPVVRKSKAKKSRRKTKKRR